MIKVRISVNSADIPDLLDGKSPQPGDVFRLPGDARCRLVSGTKQGIDAVSVLMFVLENIESVSSGLFSAWLYDKLREKNIESVEIDGETVKVEHSEIESALEKSKANTESTSDVNVDKPEE